MAILPIGADILPPSDDRVFKLILTSPEAKPALMDLISAALGRNITEVRVCNNELPSRDTEEKAERLDLNCVIDGGEQIDVEMQASRMKEHLRGEHKNLKGKSIYYLCDLHSSQSAKGKAYDELARSYQVTFCAYTLFPERKAFVNAFSMRHDEDNGLLHDAIHAMFVELSKLDDVIRKSVDDMTDMEKWAVFFRYAENPEYREVVNRVIESKEALDVAGTLLTGISQDQRERAIFRSRRMYQTDLESNLRVAEREGRAEGRAEGFEAGLAKGRAEIAVNMKREGLSVDRIVQLTGLSIEEVEKL
jgi:predicted transposase/invertase (TIGR01784 family)